MDPGRLDVGAAFLLFAQGRGRVITFGVDVD